MTERILVIGIGNPLVGDEGVGVRVAEELMTSWRFPEHVTVIDAGTMGMSMLGLFQECEHLVVVDAVDGTETPPGSVLRIEPADLAHSQVLHSLHDVKLADVLASAQLIGADPDVEFVGVQIAEMETLVTELTDAVEAAVPHAVDEVLSILAGLGVEAEPATIDSDDAHVIRALRTGKAMRRDGG